MPSIPGMSADVSYGDADAPLRDWRKTMPDDDNDDDELTPDERESLIGVLGFDPREGEPDADGDDFADKPDDAPDPHQAATLALLDYLIECKEDGTDPAAGLDRFAELGADEGELTAAMGDVRGL